MLVVEFVHFYENKVAQLTSNCCPWWVEVVSVVSKNDLRSQFYFHRRLCRDRFSYRKKCQLLLGPLRQKKIYSGRPFLSLYWWGAPCACMRACTTDCTVVFFVVLLVSTSWVPHLWALPITPTSHYLPRGANPNLHLISFLTMLDVYLIHQQEGLFLLIVALLQASNPHPKSHT